MSEHDTIINMMKASVWEEAKGKLRALVAIQGSYPNGTQTQRWKDIEDLTEEFIRDIEGNGLHE